MHHFEVHFDEAAFLWHQRGHALTSPRHTPAETAELEARLRAHVDGAVLSASTKDHERLAEALASDDAERISAATLILIDEDVQQHAPVLECLDQGSPGPCTAICQSLRTRPHPGLAPALQKRLETSPPLVQASLIDVLTEWGLAIPQLLERLSPQSPSPVRAASLRAALLHPTPSCLPLIADALTAPDAEVRDAAIIAGLKLRHPPAWETCLREATNPQPGGDLARLLVAIGGADAEQVRLLDMLTAPTPPALRQQALWALGFSGRAGVVEVCLPLLSSHEPYVARMAAETLSAITGLRMDGTTVRLDVSASAEEEQALEAALVPAPEAWLPLPHAETIRAWWETHRQQFAKDERYLNGHPRTPDALLNALREGTMRRRAPLALELMLRSQFTWAPPLGTYMTTQLRALEGLHTAPRPARMHAFRSLMGTAPPLPRESAAPPPERLERRPASRRRDAPVITALGMVSPLGLDAISSCAAARAGVSGAQELEGLEAIDASNGQTQALRGHPIPTLTQGFTGLGRLVRLGEAALAAMQPPAGVDTTQCGLFVALPSGADVRAYRATLLEEERLEAEDEPPRASSSEGAIPTPQLLSLLTKLTGLRIAHEHQRSFPGDTLGFLRALKAAEAAIQEGRLERCIVGGIDSLVSPERLEALKQLGRIKVPGQPARMMPGEGAAFLLLERSQDAAARGVPVLARCEGVHVQEASGWVSAACTGRALATSLASTLGPLEPPSPPLPGRVIGCLNGSDRRAYAWGHVQPVLAPQVSLASLPHWSPAEAFGELGAATGAVATCIAVRDFARGTTSAPESLVWLMDDQGGVGSFRARSEHRERLPTGARA